MSRADRGREQPRAMIHRRILDVAADNPEASLASLADEVSGASTSLVERVLDEYGDPSREPQSDATTDQSMETTNVSDDEPETATESASSTTDDSETDVAAESTSQSGAESGPDSAADPESQHSPDAESMPSTDTGSVSTSGAESDSGGSATDDTASEARFDEADLSEKQRRTLRAVYDRSDASQGELAEELDVTRATISRRLNAIPGFEWTDRRAFAESVFADEPPQPSEPESDTTGTENSGSTATDPDDAGSESTEPEEAGSMAAQPDGAGSGQSESVGSVQRGDRSGTTDDPVLSALGDVRASLAMLDERVSALEAPESSTESDGSESLSPELAHKVVHACMESERMNEDEELDVLRTFMGN